MLTIIIAILAAIGIVALGCWLDFPEDGVITLALCVVIIGVIVGLFVPVSGYKDWEEIETVELVTLSNDIATTGNWYAVRANGYYRYRYQINSEFGKKNTSEYVLKTVDAEDVVEVEDPDCETATLVIYEREGKASFFTFALFSYDKKYVFYVPTGSIKEEINLD